MLKRSVSPVRYLLSNWISTTDTLGGKHKILFLIIILFPLYLNAIEFNYEKINEFAIGGNYDGDGKIIVEFPYMYTASRYGLEIMNINTDTGDLQRISTLGLNGMGDSIVKKNNFVYVAKWLNNEQIGTTDLYKIDVSNLENPQITNYISMDNNYKISRLDFYNDHLIYHKCENGYYTQLVFLNNETLDEITTFPIIYITKPINDTLFVAYDGLSWDTFNLYDCSDLDNITLVANIDLTASAFEGGFIQQIDENTIGRAANEGISFWDISDIENWDLITDFYTATSCTKFGGFTKVGDFIIVPQQTAGIEAINISDIQNPYSTCFWEFPEDLMYPFFMNGSNIVNYNDYLYLGTSYHGIYKYIFIDGIIEYMNTYINYPRGFHNNRIYNNYLFTSTTTDGIYVYDISNIDNPELVYTLIDSCWIRMLKINSEKLFIYYYDRETHLDRLSIFNISNPANPQFLSDILIPGFNKYIIINENEPYAFYIHYYFDSPKIVKYDITEPTDPQIVLEYNLPVESGLGFFHEGYFYFLDNAQSYQDLYIYSGFEDNEPELAYIINNFGPDYQMGIRKVNNYIIQISHTNPDKFYEFETPVDIVEKFIIDNSSVGFYSYIHNNILFSPNSYTIRLYDLSDGPQGQLIYFDYFNGFSGYFSVNFYSQNNQEYFFYVQHQCISTYEYTINAISDEEINLMDFSLTNYPNPISSTTIISYSIPNYINSHNTIKVEIYNIKGQVVKNFEFRILNSELTKVFWDGKDENGKQVPSGIYLCKLSIGKETIVRKMVLLR
ncbi:MAG: T9SS type A sorting domain-containing protein [Candidatus Cloacimonetes bacterium]|nr:T9SS type A sorting domain-containing protein [Candidatus Cloacimonadota bacterium]